jgi:eukaryotic-like serine/threonine-protein kinase
MAIDLETRARKWLLRLGSVPGDPSEARAFVQRRVRIYLGVLLGIWGGVFLLDRIITFAFTGHLFYGDNRGTPYHLAIVAMLAMAFATSSRGERGVVAMGIVELLITPAQAAAMSAMFALGQPLMARPDLAMVLALTHVLVLRAAIVPGSPRRAIVVGLVSGAPVLAMSAYLHRTLPPDPTRPPNVLLTINIGIWLLIALVGTSAIAMVIYGLQERMRAAMKLGQYTLTEKVGEGGMGIVYRARHALLRRPTAVKVLGAKEADAALIGRFEREVQLTSEIAHPNIVSVYDFGRSPDGSFYYAMELLDGIDLQRLVRADGPQPASRVAHILQQAADALAEAHSVGLIHRDIKPANIVLCKNERRPDHVKVVDFGLVKQIGTEDPALSGANVITGTPLYMPPEALLAPNEIDGRSDLYSLGAVAYFLLTGEPVFSGVTLLEVCAQTLHEPVVPPSKRATVSIPPKLEALVMTCLAKKKEERPENADAFTQALRACDDVPAWSAAEARAWWKARGPAAETKAIEDRTPFTRTLAIAPRSDTEDAARSQL